jgi:hypothetical protein
VPSAQLESTRICRAGSSWHGASKYEDHLSPCPYVLVETHTPTGDFTAVALRKVDEVALYSGPGAGRTSQRHNVSAFVA